MPSRGDALLYAAFPNSTHAGSTVGMSSTAHDALLRGLAHRAKRDDASVPPNASALLSQFYIDHMQRKSLSPRVPSAAHRLLRAHRALNVRAAVWELARHAAV